MATIPNPVYSEKWGIPPYPYIRTLLWFSYIYDSGCLTYPLLAGPQSAFLKLEGKISQMVQYNGPERF